MISLVVCICCFHTVRSIVMPVFITAFERKYALYRSLVSLDNLYSECKWKGDLRILIDGPKQRSDDVIEVAMKYGWSHGIKTVVAQERNIGLRVQRALASTITHEFWLVVEDDVEISPLACHLVDLALPLISNDPDVFGISLTEPQWQLGINENGGWRRLDNIKSFHHEPLLYFPVVSTWAQIFKRASWNNWLNFLQSSNISTIQGSIYDSWFQRNPRIWSRDFQFFVHVSQIYSLYFNLPDDQVLAHSHRDYGMNTNMNRGPTGILLYDDGIVRKLRNASEPQRFSYCFDPEEGKNEVLLDHQGLDNQLQLNHLCYMRTKRFANIKIVYMSSPEKTRAICGLDYGGDTRLWTVKSLKRNGLFFLNENMECVRMECAYRPGLYPHISG